MHFGRDVDDVSTDKNQHKIYLRFVLRAFMNTLSEETMNANLRISNKNS